MFRSSSFALCALLLAGCSTIGEIAESAPELEPPAELAFDDTTSAVGGPLSLALVRPVSLLPSDLSLADQSAVIAADLMYDGLVEAAGEELRPALATSWKANDDFTLWHFDLDLDRVSPDDVAASFAPFVGDVGSATSQAEVLLDHVTSIDIVAGGVEFRLNRSDAGFAWLLTGVRYGVVGPDGASTGRYVVSEPNADTMVFDSADQRDVAVTWVADLRTSHDALLNGVVNAAVVGSADLGAANSEFDLPLGSRSIERFYVANIASPAMQQPELRSAVIQSIDREALVSFAPTQSFLATGVVPGAVAGAEPGACGAYCDRDTAAAASLLATMSDTPTIRVGFSAVTQAPVAQSIVEDLEFVGFSAVATEYDGPGLAAAIAAGEVDLYSFGLIAEAASVDSILPALLHSTSVLNSAQISDPALDELIDKAAVTADDEARWALLDDAHRLAMSYSVFVPVTTAHSELVWAETAGDLVVRADGSIDAQSIK